MTSPPCPICGGPSVPERRFGPAPLWRCAACEFVHLHAETDDALYADAYFAEYGEGGDYVEHAAQRRLESQRRLELLDALGKPGRLLEIGAAAGFFLAEAARRGWTCVGVEPNTAMAAYARDALACDVRDGTLADVAVEPGSFDAACAFHVVEHIDEPLPALAAVRDALRDGGILLVEVPNLASAAARRQGARWQPLDLPYHVGHHSPRSLRLLLERTGFELLRVDTVPFAHYAPLPRPLRAARGVLEGLRSGAVTRPGPHPRDHQLLRAVGRAS